MQFLVVSKTSSIVIEPVCTCPYCCSAVLRILQTYFYCMYFDTYGIESNKDDENHEFLF